MPRPSQSLFVLLLPVIYHFCLFILCFHIFSVAVFWFNWDVCLFLVTISQDMFPVLTPPMMPAVLASDVQMPGVTVHPVTQSN